MEQIQLREGEVWPKQSMSFCTMLSEELATAIETNYRLAIISAGEIMSAAENFFDSKNNEISFRLRSLVSLANAQITLLNYQKSSEDAEKQLGILLEQLFHLQSTCDYYHKQLLAFR